MKRYNLQEDFGHNLMEFEEPDGEWVKWADAKAETDTLMEQLRAAWKDQKKLVAVREWWKVVCKHPDTTCDDCDSEICSGAELRAILDKK